MKINLPKSFIKLIKKGRFTVNHRKGGVGENFYSLGLPSLNVIVKGQCKNLSDFKNAVLLFFRANTDELLGKRLDLVLFLIEVVLNL